MREVSYDTDINRARSKHAVGAAVEPHPAVASEEYSVVPGPVQDHIGPGGERCCWLVVVKELHA